MARPRQEPPEPEGWDRWQPRIRNTAASLLGGFLLVWQTVWEDRAQAALVAAGIALIGVPISDYAARLLGRVLGGGKP